MTEHILGEGVLSWQRGERVTDRYGYVYLAQRPMDDPMDGESSHVSLAIHAGSGTLVARIRATRQSPHIGDLSRGIFPSTPAVGDEITLGTGELDYEGTSVGLLPLDGRETDWLDPRALYRCHEQTVQLVFIPDED